MKGAKRPVEWKRGRPGWRALLDPRFFDSDGMPICKAASALVPGYSCFWIARVDPDTGHLTGFETGGNGGILTDYAQSHFCALVGSVRRGLLLHDTECDCLQPIDYYPGIGANRTRLSSHADSFCAGVYHTIIGSTSQLEFCVHLRDLYDPSSGNGYDYILNVVDAAARDRRLRCRRAAVITLHRIMQRHIAQREIRLMVAHMVWDSRRDAAWDALPLEVPGKSQKIERE